MIQILIPLLTSLTIVSILLSAVFAMAWRSMNRPAHALTWSLAYGCGAIEWLMHLADGTIIAGGVIYWTVAAVPLLTSIVLAVVGFRQRRGLPSRPALLLVICLLVTTATALTLTIWRHDGINVALLPVCATAMLPVAVHTLLLHGNRSSFAERACIITLTIFAIFEGAVAILALRIGQSGLGGANYNLYLLVLFTGLPGIYIAAGISALFLLTSDQTEILDQLARHDSLTGILNRRALFEAATESVNCLANGSIIVADIDHFKNINDQWGHRFGDRVITDAVRSITGCLRKEDIIGRLGGDEFVIILPGLTTDCALELCESVSHALSIIRYDSCPQFKVSMSFGITDFSGKKGSVDALLEVADRALYRAKAVGRDRSCVAE